ncbi:MAG: DUF2975 domain-containing protein [Prevotellaceae bacterium]|nr:DUF2975 domain-containing protein [Candidatus Minthosoma equi]
MKKKFNIYCGLLISAIIFGIGIHAFQLSSFMWYGIEAGVDAVIYEKNHPGTHVLDNTHPQNTMTSIELFPKHLLTGTNDSILNKKTGNMVGIQPLHVIATPNDATHINRNTFMGFIGWIEMALMVVFWIAFIKFIITVNKGQLFERKMEKQMEWGGWSVFGIYILELASVFINYFLNVQEFDFADFDIAIYQVPEPSLLYSAFGMLLLGQIFRIGRKMKEEQELTI